MQQIITYNANDLLNFKKRYKISELKEFESFDNYDTNIIDLSNEKMWKGNKLGNLNNISDLKTLSVELSNVKKSDVVIVLPQNCTYSYEKSFNGTYRESIKMKDIIPTWLKIIEKNLFEFNCVKISYSKNTTIINNLSFKSDFNFDKTDLVDFSILTDSNGSNKITTIKLNNIILTTLNIFESPQHISNFLSYIFPDEKQNMIIPDWVSELNFYNDEQLKKIKLEKINEIEKINDEISKLDIELEQNNEYKKVLYETGDELVKVVMKMLDDLLDNDSSEFVDEKKEDFLIKKDNITFIGEIKGISQAISNKNVSQLDVHVQNYFDKINKMNITENIKGLLIINHQRNKKISERNEVHQNQIDLAKRNNALIIETNILLKLYEKYLKKEINTEDVIKLLSEKNGVLTEKDI